MLEGGPAPSPDADARADARRRATPTPAPTADARARRPRPARTASRPMSTASSTYANDHFELAQAALRDGDFATYGEEIAKVEAALQRLGRADRVASTVTARAVTGPCRDVARGRRGLRRSRGRRRDRRTSACGWGSVVAGVGGRHARAPGVLGARACSRFLAGGGTRGRAPGRSSSCRRRPGSRTRSAGRSARSCSGRRRRAVRADRRARSRRRSRCSSAGWSSGRGPSARGSASRSTGRSTRGSSPGPATIADARRGARDRARRHPPAPLAGARRAGRRRSRGRRSTTPRTASCSCPTTS